MSSMSAVVCGLSRRWPMLYGVSWAQSVWRQIVSGELEEVVANDQESFPDNRSIWLKDLASVLHLRLINVPMTDPVFADQSAGESCTGMLA